jgi:hypothetical protein
MEKYFNYEEINIREPIAALERDAEEEFYCD